jgi:hypothetical protein
MQTQFVKINSEYFLCTMADDEGTDNAVDMDRFYVYANGFNCTGPGDPGVQFNPVDEVVFGWSSPGWFEMGDGHPVVFDAVGSLQLAYNCVDYDFSNAKLVLKAYCRDYDGGWSANESAVGQITLIGSDIWGPHVIMLYSEDFRFECHVTVAPANKTLALEE